MKPQVRFDRLHQDWYYYCLEHTDKVYPCGLTWEEARDLANIHHHLHHNFGEVPC